MRRFYFSLAVSAEKTRSIYRGQARYVLAESDDGVKLQLPAANFREFVDSEGIHGRFCVRIDADNRILELARV